MSYVYEQLNVGQRTAVHISQMCFDLSYIDNVIEREDSRRGKHLHYPLLWNYKNRI